MSEPEVTRRTFVERSAAAGAGLIGALAHDATAGEKGDSPRPRSYHQNMEYRRLGRTGLMLSVVSMGGHWKRVATKPGTDEFKRNRRETIAAAMDLGVNYIDACWSGEVKVYAEALGPRRKDIYFGFDWTLGRDPKIAGSLERMKQGLDDGLREAGLDYVDLWRVTIREQATRNTQQEIDTIMAALEWGKKTGKARFTGISTHHRPWIAEAVAKYPQIEVVLTPYSAGSKEKPVGSMFDALRKHDVGLIGIKPFAGGMLFQTPGAPDAGPEENNRRARMALRYVLSCDVLTCAIPGLASVDEVRSAVAAVSERRQFDLAEARQYEEMTRQMWANLPRDYQWLRDWRWV